MRDCFSHMLYELESNCLDVRLIPAREQRHSVHMVRARTSQNIKWYRDLCKEFQSNRNSRKGRYKKHGDTKIKRQRIIAILKRLANGESFDSKYKGFLVDVAKNMKEQFEYEMDDTSASR